jgi:hypothetical protein
MEAKDEMILVNAGLFDEQGRLFSSTQRNAWERPLKVRLIPVGDCLRVKFRSKPGNTSAKVVPSPDLLEKFLSLAEAPSRRIQKFAERYGCLSIFYSPVDRYNFKNVYDEHCDVWRYFARSMRALLKIAAQFYSGRSGSKEDWDVIGNPPEATKSGEWRKDAENNWTMLAAFVARNWVGDRDRDTFVGLLNSLLWLGNVRPWVKWKAGTTRPQIVYNSPRLLAHLALQLCLRITKLESFITCDHCKKEFTPVKRAPKTGYRTFCPECRAARIPQKYADKDRQTRKKDNSHG